MKLIKKISNLVEVIIIKFKFKFFNLIAKDLTLLKYDVLSNRVISLMLVKNIKANITGGQIYGTYKNGKKFSHKISIKEQGENWIKIILPCDISIKYNDNKNTKLWLYYLNNVNGKPSFGNLKIDLNNLYDKFLILTKRQIGLMNYNYDANKFKC